MTPEELARKADSAGLRLVRCLWCGNDGTIRAKASSRHGLEGRLARGIGVTRAMQAMNALDQLQPVDGYGPVGEFRLVPDLDTFRTLPYAPKSGVVLTDHVLPDGTPAGVCQRTFLKRQQARLRERGLELRAAFENEFSLARREDGDYTPVDTSLCFSTIAMAKSREFVDALVAALEAQRIPLEQYYAELGHGQQEVSTAHASAVQAADEQVLVRETIRGVAAEQELVASLAPKPWPGVAGNGAHVHFSLWEGEQNRFYAEGGLSELAQQFLAGADDLHVLRFGDLRGHQRAGQHQLTDRELQLQVEFDGVPVASERQLQRFGQRTATGEGRADADHMGIDKGHRHRGDQFLDRGEGGQKLCLVDTGFLAESGDRERPDAVAVDQLDGGVPEIVPTYGGVLTHDCHFHHSCRVVRGCSAATANRSVEGYTPIRRIP